MTARAREAFAYAAVGYALGLLVGLAADDLAQAIRNGERRCSQVFQAPSAPTFSPSWRAGGRGASRASRVAAN